MMFGAGIGIGMLTWSVAEPLYHFQKSPETLLGLATPKQADNVLHSFKWAYFNWGLSAWCCYALCGLALGYYAHRKALPLTIRSALSGIFGRFLSGPLGHVIDIAAIVATVLGVAQTLGFGVEQFLAGLNHMGLGDWMLTDKGKASAMGVIFAVFIIIGLSTLSALSGIGRGIKWLSNVNMGLSLCLLGFFLIFGAGGFGIMLYLGGIGEYLITLPKTLFKVWPDDGRQVSRDLIAWQGAWTVFTFAWWIAFAPFVGLFLARISKGRTLGEYLLGAIIPPSLISLAWFAFAGGSAVELELTGQAGGALFAASDGGKIFTLIDLILTPIKTASFVQFIGVDSLSIIMALIIVSLLLFYLVTSADSAILIINTINSGGQSAKKSDRHIIFWGLILGFVIAVLLFAGGLDAIKTAMVIGALPFSFIMSLMCISLLRGIIQDVQIFPKPKDPAPGRSNGLG